jgi:hypothetical protein
VLLLQDGSALLATEACTRGSLHAKVWPDPTRGSGAGLHGHRSCALARSLRSRDAVAASLQQLISVSAPAAACCDDLKLLVKGRVHLPLHAMNGDIIKLLSALATTRYPCHDSAFQVLR